MVMRPAELIDHLDLSNEAKLEALADAKVIAHVAVRQVTAEAAKSRYPLETVMLASVTIIRGLQKGLASRRPDLFPEEPSDG